MTLFGRKHEAKERYPVATKALLLATAGEQRFIEGERKFTHQTAFTKRAFERHFRFRPEHVSGEKAFVEDWIFVFCEGRDASSSYPSGYGEGTPHWKIQMICPRCGNSCFSESIRDIQDLFRFSESPHPDSYHREFCTDMKKK